MEATFSQLDIDFDRGRVFVEDSNWGKLEIKFFGSPDFMYLNVSATGNWVIQNIPVVSIEGAGILQSMVYYFFLGIDSGQRIERLNYGLTLISAVRTSPPPQTQVASLQHASVVFASGLREREAEFHDASIAGFLVGAEAQSSEKLIHEGVPNQKARLNECVPVALSNSLKWLKKQGVALTDAEASIANMKQVVKWTPAGAGQQWVELKKKFRPDLITTRTTQEIEKVIEAFKAKCDVELSAGPHVAAVAAITPEKDGTFSMDMANDAMQGPPGPGTPENLPPETITYDPKKRTVKGHPIWGNGKVSHFIIECPTKKPPAPTPSPSPSPKPSPSP